MLFKLGKSEKSTSNSRCISTSENPRTIPAASVLGTQQSKVDPSYLFYNQCRNDLNSRVSRAEERNAWCSLEGGLIGHRMTSMAWLMEVRGVASTAGRMKETIITAHYNAGVGGGFRCVLLETSRFHSVPLPVLGSAVWSTGASLQPQPLALHRTHTAWKQFWSVKCSSVCLETMKLLYFHLPQLY